MGILALVSLSSAYETAMHFTGVAIDGPFQLYNALRRIQAGFRPGVDFQFFHGMGVPYAHYWLYRLWGGGLRGSELARELLSAVLYPVVYVVVFRAFTRSWTIAFALTAAALAVTYFLNMASLQFAMNGMLGLRSSVPTLLPGVMLIDEIRRRRLAGGIVLGLALLMSTEQGLAVTLALVVVSAVSAWRAVDRRSRRSALVDAGATIGTGVAFLIVSLLVIGGWFGMLGVVRYNFRLVPMDQYWYFGAPPNLFISSWGTGVALMVQSPRVGLGLVLTLIAVAVYLRRLWRTPSIEPRRNFALALLAVYGLVSFGSLLGIFNLSYDQPCWRCLIIIAFVEATRAMSTIDRQHARQSLLGVPRLVAVFALLLPAMAFTIPLVPTALVVSLPHIVKDHIFGDERFSIGSMWSETLASGQAVVNAHRGAAGTPPTLWSTYAGWLEARNGMYHPSFDYIIHALGPKNRSEYVAKFRSVKPDLVQTIRPTYTQYEQWLEAENWNFYEALLDNYKVTSGTPWSIFWDRRAMPAPAESVGEMMVPPGTRQVQLPPLVPDTAGHSLILAEVEVRYSTHNPFRALPMIGASPRYIITVEDAVTPLPVSLDPWVSTMRFPLVIAAGHRPILHFETFSLLPGAGWSPEKLTVFVRHIDSGNSAWVADIMRYFAPRTPH